MGSIAINMKFLSLDDADNDYYITSTKVGNRIWYQEIADMNLRLRLTDSGQSPWNDGFNVQCVER